MESIHYHSKSFEVQVPHDTDFEEVLKARNVL